MAYWLIKSEPSKGMWDIIEKKGKKGCFWKREKGYVRFEDAQLAPPGPHSKILQY